METKSVLKGFGIVVADRGFVFVGNLDHDGEWCNVYDAKNIRRWGTTSGLGEIAKNGPTPETKLDDYGTVRVPDNSVICIIDADAEKWA